MRKLREIFLKAALIAAAVITGGILLFLIGIILKRGLPQLSWSFLTTATSYLAGTTGILPNICNTLYLILIAMGAALPLGVGAAVYITEYAENPRVVRLISFAAETLTGIPSILFGLIGMLFFIKLGRAEAGRSRPRPHARASWCSPRSWRTRARVCSAVPRAYREGALALGSGKWHMVRTVVLRTPVDGIDDPLHPLRRPYHRRERGASLYRGLWSAAAWIQGGARILLGVAFCGAVSLRKRAGQV